MGQAVRYDIANVFNPAYSGRRDRKRVVDRPEK